MTAAADECIHGLMPTTCATCLHGHVSDTEVAERKHSRCRSCDSTVMWGVSKKSRKRVPVDAGRVSDGNIRISELAQDGTPIFEYGPPGSGDYVSHFLDVP